MIELCCCTLIFFGGILIVVLRYSSVQSFHSYHFFWNACTFHQTFSLEVGTHFGEISMFELLTPLNKLYFLEVSKQIHLKSIWDFHANWMKNPNKNLGRANSLQVCNLFRVYLYSKEQKFEISCQLDEKSKWKLG